MAQATMDAKKAAEIAALHDAARAFDRARMRQIGSFHFALVMGALTLWGAGETWAHVTGWAIAQFAAVANALVAGFVIAPTLHEWGHFAGARLSGSVSPVLEEPRRYFGMFDFAMDENDTRQFTWMSWGGILAPWGAVFLAGVLVPLGITSGAVFFATLVAKAVAVGAFEIPVVLRAGQSGEPGAELGKQVRDGGLPRSRQLGAGAGALCFALVWMAA